MNSNKDLERIKEQIAIIGTDPECSTFHDEQTTEIIDIASRMAAENERLNMENSQLRAYDKRQRNEIEKLEEKIEYLKAEIKKKHEVIKCGECKFKKHCNRSILRFNIKDAERFFDKKVFYCSNGQNEESEKRNEQQ